MARVNLPLTISASGASDSFYLPPGDNWLFVTAASWGIATLQVSPSGDDGSFIDAKDANGDAIVFAANFGEPIAGGVVYRLNVTSYSAAITVDSRRATQLTY